MVEVRGTGASPDIPATPAVPVEPATSYVDWPAIFAGVMVATAIAFVLGTFGAALGLSLTSPYENEGIGAIGLAIGVGIWIVWVAASSFMAGGYLTGRLRRRVADATEDEVSVRDGVHGLVVWGVGVVVGGFLLASGAMTTVQTAATVASTAASTAAAAGAEVIDSVNIEKLADTLLRSDRASANNATAADQVLRIMENGADISDEDREYLATLIANRTGLSEEEAEARVTTAINSLESAEQAARDAADAARKASIVSAFIVAASLLIAAAGAYWAAGVGGRHRDEHTVIKNFGSWR